MPYLEHKNLPIIPAFQTMPMTITIVSKQAIILCRIIPKLLPLTVVMINDFVCRPAISMRTLNSNTDDRGYLPQEYLH